MSALLKTYQELSTYYDKNYFWEQIEELYEQENKAKQNNKTQANAAAGSSNRNANDEEDDDDDVPLASTQQQLRESTAAGIRQLQLVRRALRDSNVISLLSEICSTLRNLRCESSPSYSNKYDNWEEVIKISPRDQYLSFVYALAGLANLDIKNSDYIKISFTTISTYLLSLTIPGAKAFHIFDEDVIAHCLQVFSLIERMHNPEVMRSMTEHQKSNVWCRLITLCDDIKVLLRFVHFNEYKTTRDGLLKRIIGIQYLNYERGFANKSAATLHQYCYEIFDVMINEHNGDPEETLMKLLNMTALLHTYAAKPKGQGASTSYTNSCDHISDWFVKNIAKYPRLLTKVLSYYIECMVTNPIKTWKPEQVQRTLDYAAKYDAALYKLSNVSCVKFLSESIYSEEASIRARTIELMSRMLQIESNVDWQMFRHEVSDIPREVYIIKELIDSLQDACNMIKVKAVQALHTALTKGSPNARKVMSEGIKFSEFNDKDVQMPDEPPVRKNEKRFSKPKALTPECTFQGFELVKEAFLELPQYVYLHLFRNPHAYIRRAGILFMEDIIKLNPLILFNTNFVEETVRLVDEPTALVRKQMLQSVDAILQCYPNCYPVIWVWCKLISPMLHDADPKNIDIAIECFRSRVLLNMRGFDSTNKPEHFMPWVIIRTLLCTQSRYYLQNCFHLALRQNISAEIVKIIESHLHTTNSSEAWVVLNFITSKVKSKEPDVLLHAFMSMDSWNKETNMFIALEVLANCIKDFSHTALNLAFNHIQKHMREGTLLPVFVGKAFDFLLNIDNRNAQSKNSQASGTDKVWLNELHSHLEQCLLNEMKEFPDNRGIFMSHLFSYSEVNLQTRIRPSSLIIDFVHNYLSGFMRKFDYAKELENERIFNAMIIIAARFSLRDAYVASRTCNLYAGILKKHDKPTIVNTLIVALTDICKKHTSCFERVMDRVLVKLESPFPANRMETFKCFERLVLQDQLKLRGTLLVALLGSILDECEKLAERACQFFGEYLSKKDGTLFQKCLVDCPFVLNEYKNFEELDSTFGSAVKSPLKGDAKLEKRQLLYNYMMLDMDEIFLILYFDRLKLIAEKSKTDPQMKSTEGVGLVKDVLYILKHICETTKEQKSNVGNENKEPGENDELDNELSQVADKTKNAAVTTGMGRGRRRREVTTMADALSLVEKSLVFVPTIYKNLHAYDKSLEPCFDELCMALAQRFATYVDYAEPAQFWRKYRKAKHALVAQGSKNQKTSSKAKPTKGKRRRRISDSSDESDDDDDDDDDDDNDNDENADNAASTVDTTNTQAKSDINSTKRRQKTPADDTQYDSDNDQPLAAAKPLTPRTQAKRSRKSYDDISMEYLFNPNI